MAELDLPTHTQKNSSKIKMFCSVSPYYLMTYSVGNILKLVHSLNIPMLDLVTTKLQTLTNLMVNVT